MVRAIFVTLLMLFASISFSSYAHEGHSPDNPLWHAKDASGKPVVKLYFFWSKTCPHCAEAHPFIDELPKKYPWISLESEMITAPGARDKWQQIASATGTDTRSVPFFAICGKASIGYSSAEVTGAFLVSRLKECYLSLGGVLDASDDTPVTAPAGNAPLFGTCSSSTEAGTCDSGADTSASSNVQPVELPFIGVVTPDQLSLPLLTLVLAGVDAFNPCAFFVLLFLLSIMVNAKSRSRMLIVGGIFVFFSGFIYFLFMTAWLNMFELLGADGDGGTIILAAGVLALVAGSLNIKDFFFEKGEVTLSMSAEKRTGLIKRMGKLSSASSMTAMIIGTTVLAILANAYELLCTAGFPMIYTSVLAMHELPSTERYFYLVMYNLVYVIPLALIVLVFALTLGKRKLSEKEGESLKLMSGVMMVGLGGMLVWDPTSLQNVALAIGLIVGSILLTTVILLGRKLLATKAASQ
ncbi:thioredoxin family protein [Shewanella sp. JM162201]|uniref:Thioredoxin family protein n=1 Tax=Shewanella jiangmenensis TaxID=2837387 RepID=A0ABS5V5F8_9GAMM|nr:thioredoxin family protein [Shewanella jiangmenensis]MBT1444283.1 thioredoxin family protein [Shewanella jiangmenensis]